MSKKARFYIIFFSVLMLVFYFALTRIIPGYGDAGLPVLSLVQPFSFVDQTGQGVTNKTVQGKVYVAEFFFTTCKGICPKMNKNLRIIYDKFLDEGGFLILSHSVDPGTDSVSRLKRYADSLQVSGKTWHFLTGSKDSLYHAARVSYLLDDPKNSRAAIDQQFIHTQFFALVDRNARVRKIYDGLKKEEIERLINDIKSLLKEKATPASMGNSLPNN